MAFDPAAMRSRLSLRRSTATSFASRIVSAGSLGKRIESSSTRTGLSFDFDARRSIGMCSSASVGTKRRKYGRPHARATPSPAGLCSNRPSSSASASSSARCASASSRLPSPTLTRAVTSWW
jgi:hypothetical protein